MLNVNNIFVSIQIYLFVDLKFRIVMNLKFIENFQGFV